MSFDLILPFFRPIEHLLLSDTVSEVMVNPDSSVWIEEDGQKIHLHRIYFEQGALEAGLEVIANRFGKKLDADSPIMNLRLPDGSRLAAMIPPVVNPGPLLTIRKFTSRKLKMNDLISHAFVTAELAARLQEAIRRGDNILVSGGTGTGKTTLVNILANSIPDDDRILIIEDTAELAIRKPHVVSAEAQLDTHKSTITFDDLLKAILRHRPDRIILGEVRGAEARTLLDILNTGHRGMLATIHASSCHGALRRLANLATRAPGSGYPTAIEEIRASIRATPRWSCDFNTPKLKGVVLFGSDGVVLSSLVLKAGSGHPDPVKIKQAVGDGAVLFVQFDDGTTWGDSGVARRLLDSRPQRLAFLKRLVETYYESDEAAFDAVLNEPKPRSPEFATAACLKGDAERDRVSTIDLAKQRLAAAQEWHALGIF